MKGILQDNCELIERCIVSCKSHEQLVTCTRMINERIAIWGAWPMVTKLSIMVARQQNTIATREKRVFRLRVV